MAELPRIKEKIETTIDLRSIKEKPKDAQRVQEEIKLVRIECGVGGAQTFHRVKNVDFVKCIFSRQTFFKINFYNCTFTDCILNGAEFESCEFHSCRFVNSCFFKASFEKTYLDPRSFNFSAKWYWHYANVNVWLFQELYRNSKDIHQEVFAMHADRRFQFYKRYENIFGQRKSVVKFISSLVYDMVLGCGYGIWNALVCTVLGVSLFAFIIKDHIGGAGDINIVKALYFAVVSFTTVGYGDILPEKDDFALILTMLFLFCSVIWLAIVTAIIVKRMVK